MNNKKWSILITFFMAILLCSCNGESDESLSTERLDVGQGIHLQEQVNDDELEENDIVLTPADLEGMQEVATVLIKDADIYSKPSISASKIGQAAEGEEIGVYGRIDGEDWYVVSFYGRVGYILSDCIEEDEIENVIVPSNDTTNSNDTNPSNNPENDNDSENEVDSDNDTESESETRPDEDESSTENDDGESTEKEEGTETPGDTEGTEEPSEKEEPQEPDDSEKEEPDDVPSTEEGTESSTEVPEPSTEVSETAEDVVE